MTDVGFILLIVTGFMGGFLTGVLAMTKVVIDAAEGELTLSELTKG